MDADDPATARLTFGPDRNDVLTVLPSELPVALRINDLPKSQQPRSDDPEFWGVWVGKGEADQEITRSIDWKNLAKDWQAEVGSTQPTEQDQ